MSKRRISRRQFLAASAQTAGVFAAFPRVGSAHARPPGTTAALESILATPPHAAKPMTRWWWFGGAVTPAEITRELTFMSKAGLRGAEIQPVYPVELDDPARGIRNLRYYSPEWFDVVRHAVKEARRLGLQLDFTLGSGWPYGGPFIPPALAARRIRVLSQDVVGPAPVTWNVGHLLVEDDRVIATVAVPMRDGVLDLSHARVLEGQPSALMSDGGRVGTAVQGWSAPAGLWRVMLFLNSTTGMQVKRPTYGMEGLVLDHHSREATDLFLRSAGDQVLKGLAVDGDAPFTSIFCDSLEVYGADWTTRLPEEFQARRGYDLKPNLPALFHDVGPRTPHIRYDYHLTLSDLIIENFFQPLAKWAEANRMTTRVQAHGAMGDVMRGYGIAHVPEGESIFLGDRYAVNLKHRRLASSAAHLYERPVASAESYTWLRTPTFTTTLEMMKALSDAMFLDGINQLVNHGYSYSPPEAGEPGWAFYASTEVNHTNTWWRHYPHLAQYVQATCALLREGRSVNAVGVYLPIADVYAGVGAGGLHLDVEIERQVDANLLNGIRRAGYDFDLLNDHALASRAAVADGELRIGTGRYRVVIVPATKYMPPESARRFAEFVAAGGHVIVVGDPPTEAPGVRDLEQRSAQVRTALAAGPRVHGGLDVEGAIRQLRTALAPDFEIASIATAKAVALQDAIENVGFTHRRIGENDLYLVANVSDRARDLRVRFDVAHRSPQRWTTETRRIEGEPPYAFGARADGSRYTEVEIRLDAFESCCIVFGSSSAPPAVTAASSPANWLVTRESGTTQISALAESGVHQLRLRSGGSKRVAVDKLPAAIPLDGPWRLALGDRAPVTLDRLRPWNEIDGGKGYSGWGHYLIEVDVPDVSGAVEWMLELGKVHETAEAAVNDSGIGTAWKGTRRLSCGKAIKRGRNQLRIAVANLWIHHVLAHGPDDPARHLRGVGPYPALAETAGIRWGTYGEVPAEQVPPSGLLGPVRLAPLKRVSVRV